MAEAGAERGIQAFIQFMFALKDGLDIKTLVGTMKNKIEKQIEGSRQNITKKRLRQRCRSDMKNVSYL